MMSGNLLLIPERYGRSACRGCRECRREISRRHRNKLKIENPEKLKREYKNTALKGRYGITVQDFDAMEKSQNGVCAICGNKPGKKGFSVDHDHDGNYVRDLLCSYCNTALGLLREDIPTFLSAVKYIERWNDYSKNKEAAA